MKETSLSRSSIPIAVLSASILAGLSSCASMGDVGALPAATADSTRGIFDSEKLAAVTADYREDSAIFTCTQAACGGDATVLFQIVTLTDEQKRLLRTDQRNGYSALADEAAIYFVLPADPGEGPVEKGPPSFTEQRGIMARHQTITIPSPSDQSRKTARLVLLADQAQSHVLIAYSKNEADAVKAADKILLAWGNGSPSVSQ